MHEFTAFCESIIFFSKENSESLFLPACGGLGLGGPGWDELQGWDPSAPTECPKCCSQLHRQHLGFAAALPCPQPLPRRGGRKRRLQENFASWFENWLITERKGWGGEWGESKEQQMVSSLHPCPKLLQIHHPPSFQLNPAGCSERWVSAKCLFQLSPKSSLSKYNEWGPGVRHLKSVIKHKKYVSGFPGSWFTQLGKKGVSG